MSELTPTATTNGLNGPGPGITHDVNRSGDADSKQGATLEEANDKEKIDRPTPLLRQSNKSPTGNAQSRVPSGKLQSSNMPSSNRAMPIISDEGEETTRSPTNPSPRRVSRQTNVVYTGGAITHDCSILFITILFLCPPSLGPRYHVLVVDDSALSRKVKRHTLLNCALTHTLSCDPHTHPRPIRSHIL